MNAHVESSESVPEVEVPAVEGPGRRLREAREAGKLTLENVGAQLKLKPAFIAALERDDYDALPSILFARGYLRAYARLVGLPVDEVVSAFEALGLKEERPALPKGAILTSHHRRGERLLIRWGSAAVAIVLIGLIAVWFKDEVPRDLIARLGLGGEATESTTSGAVPQPLSTRSGPTRLSVPAPPVARQQEAGAPASSPEPSDREASDPVMGRGFPATDVAGEGITAAQEEKTQETSGSVAETVKPAPPRPVASAPRTTADTVAATTPVPAPEDATAAPAGVTDTVTDDTVAQDGVRLELVVRADSWAEVTDATGERLVYRLLRAGTPVSVTGVPPFSVFLGNAPGVTVLYDGATFTDYRPNRKGVARFSVGSR